MTKEECIALLIRYAEYDGMGIPNLAGCKEAMRMAAKLLSQPQPSIPSDLDDYAREAALETTRQMQAYTNEPMTEYGFNLILEMLEEAIHRGAEWMAGQGCTVEIDEGYFINNPHHDRRKGKFHKYYSSTFGHSEKIVVTPGDKVVVQIRKK